MPAARLSTVAIALALFAASCEVPFDPTAPADATPYIMCVLNAKDSVQYVRVERSYVCRENAYNFSKNADSVYYPPEDIIVKLTRFDTLDGSIMEDPIIFMADSLLTPVFVFTELSVRALTTDEISFSIRAPAVCLT